MKPESDPSTPFGEVVRILIHRRGLTGKQLADQAGISATGISQILTGKFKPRQKTYKRLMDALVTNEEEKALFVDAFSGEAAGSGIGSEARAGGREFQQGWGAIPPGEEAADFEREICLVLSERGWTPRATSRVLPYHDFVLDTEPRIFVICKARVSILGWFEAIGQALYQTHRIPGARAVVAVPYKGLYFERHVSNLFKKYDVPVATPDSLGDTVAKLAKPSGKALAPDVDAGNKGDGLQR